MPSSSSSSSQATGSFQFDRHNKEPPSHSVPSSSSSNNMATAATTTMMHSVPTTSSSTRQNSATNTASFPLTISTTTTAGPSSSHAPTASPSTVHHHHHHHHHNHNQRLPPPQVTPSSNSSTSSLRLSRRLSHPSVPPTRTRSEQEDGEFIKKAFERLAVAHSSPSASTSASASATPSAIGINTTTTTPSTAAPSSPFPTTLHTREATPQTSSPIDHTRSSAVVASASSPPEEIPLTLYPNQSRGSIASTTSHPFSAASTFSYGDGASIHSSYPLLAGNGHGNGNNSGHDGASSSGQGISPPSLGVTSGGLATSATSHLRTPSWSSQTSGLAQFISPSTESGHLQYLSTDILTQTPAGLPPLHASPFSYNDSGSTAAVDSLFPRLNASDTGSTVNNNGAGASSSSYPHHHHQTPYAPTSASAAASVANTDLSAASIIGWSDPFADTAEQARSSRSRLRRSSTISGYSVSSQDWSSLRRGSFPSLDGGGVPSHQQHPSQRMWAGGNAGHSPGPGPGPGPPSHSSSSNSAQVHQQEQQQTLSGTVTPTDHPSRQRIPVQNPISSMRWEAWAAAYRESVLQQRQILNPLNQARRGSRDWIRQPSIMEEPSASSLERDNTFYRLRRQFVPRAGSRGEANRILVLELCHALEEYAGALAVLWRTAQAESPRVRLASLVAVPLPASGSISGSSASGQGQQSSGSNIGSGNGGGNGRSALSSGSGSNSGSVSSPEKGGSRSDSSPESPALVLQRGSGSGSPGFSRNLSTSVDKVQIELLADEVDSLVREIIEAVPAFSSSLSQGHYGPLPFAINTQHTTAADISIQTYLELISVVPSSSSAPYSDGWQPSATFGVSRPTNVHAQRHHAAGALALDPLAAEAEQDAISTAKWWPNRLRKDLRDGLLVDDVQDSPLPNLQSISALPSDAPIPNTSVGDARDHTRGPRQVSSTGPVIDEGSSDSRTRTRNDQLLAEGRRRWREYVQGRT